MNKQTMLSPKLDIVFHMLFGEQKNEKITKSLIQNVIKEQVESIELEKTPYLWGNEIDDKVGIIDIRAKINNDTHVNIEMQMADQKGIEQRMLFYWSKLYSKQLKESEKYYELEKTICILFLNDEIKRLNHLPMQTTWKIIEEKERKTILTNDFELHIIEIPKAEKCKDIGELKKWIIFLENPNGKETREMAKEDEEIKEAVEKLEEISADEAKRRIAELREKHIHDQNTNIYAAKEEGKIIGKTEGKLEGIREIAKRMKEKNMQVEYIMEITKLTKEEIENL